MVKIEVSEEVYRRLKAFTEIIDTILEEKLPDIDAYANLVLSIGINRMLCDPLPDDELLTTTIVAMFKENPEFVANFIAKKLREGKEMEELERAKSVWTRMVI